MFEKRPMQNREIYMDYMVLEISIKKTRKFLLFGTLDTSFHFSRYGRCERR